MKLILILLSFSLFNSVTPSRITTNVYPCPHSGSLRLAHAWSCSKYVQCLNGVAVERDCSEDLFFSPTNQYCTAPEIANCVVERSPCPLWTDPEDLFYLADTSDCGLYYMCFDGQPLTMRCAPQLQFSRDTNQCIRNNSSSCPVSGIFCGREQNRLIADPSDCTRFFHCHEGTLYNGQCRNGMNFESVTSRCVEGFAVCETPTPSPPTTTTAVPGLNLDDFCEVDVVGRLAVVAHPERCDWFIDCVVGRGYLVRCPYQEIFSAERESCMPGSAETCEFFEGVTQWPTTLTTPVTGGPDFNIDLFCQPELVGNVASVAHPQRCDWYISCLFGSGTIGRCGWEEIFSTTVSRCVQGNVDTCEVMV